MYAQAMVVFAVLTMMALAVNYTWVGAAGSWWAWQTPSKWSALGGTGTYPDDGNDNATISAKTGEAEIELQQNESIRVLTVNNLNDNNAGTHLAAFRPQDSEDVLTVRGGILSATYYDMEITIEAGFRLETN